MLGAPELPSRRHDMAERRHLERDCFRDLLPCPGSRRPETGPDRRAWVDPHRDLMLFRHADHRAVEDSHTFAAARPAAMNILQNEDRRRVPAEEDLHAKKTACILVPIHIDHAPTREVARAVEEHPAETARRRMDGEDKLEPPVGPPAHKPRALTAPDDIGQ